MTKKIFGVGEHSINTLESGVIADRHKTVIGVKGIGPGAGATFTAMNLVFEMAQQAGTSEGVTFAEGTAASTDRLSAMRMLDVDPVYRRISEKARTKIYKNVNWVFGTEDLRSLPGNFIIADNPGHYDELDLIAAVIDPLPSRIETGIETYRTLREQQVPVIWIMNKANKQAGIREVERYLKLKFDHRIEMLPAEIFYRAEYACTQQYFLQKPQSIEKIARTILEHNK